MNIKLLCITCVRVETNSNVHVLPFFQNPRFHLGCFRSHCSVKPCSTGIVELAHQYRWCLRIILEQRKPAGQRHFMRCSDGPIFIEQRLHSVHGCAALCNGAIRRWQPIASLERGLFVSNSPQPGAGANGWNAHGVGAHGGAHQWSSHLQCHGRVQLQQPGRVAPERRVFRVGGLRLCERASGHGQLPSPLDSHTL